MASTFSCLEPFDYVGFHDAADSFQRYETDTGMNKQQQTFFSSQDLENCDCRSSQYCFHQKTIAQEEVQSPKDQLQHQQSFSDFGMVDDFDFDTICPPYQSPQQSLNLDTVLNELSEVIMPKENSQAASTMQLEIQNKSGFKRKHDEEINMESNGISITMDSQRLSTEEVMRVAGEGYIQSSVQIGDNLLKIMHRLGRSMSGLSEEETKDVQLAHLLLASAEKVGNQQFDRGSKLLTQCEYLSSSSGRPVQRVVYYFAEALRERIFRETGRIPSKGFPTDTKEGFLDIEVAMMSPNTEVLACYELLPFSQVLLFPGVQAIIENVALARKVHLIDLAIKIGVPWTILMQALAERQGCPLELLKITAIGTTNQEKMQETGERLISFAESMDLPFSFKIVMISDLKDLKEELFDLVDDEEIAVYSPFMLRTMLNRPDRLDSLMKVMRSLNPCVMVIIEVEGNHNSPSFFNRFIEALFFYGAFFDCLDACMDCNNQSRMIMERMYLGQGIMNMVATEGEERKFRHVGIDVWRAFFMRFGWVETEFSHSSTYQASLLLKQYACGSSCTLGMNAKSLTVGWKGTPMNSLSAWKLN